MFLHDVQVQDVPNSTLRSEALNSTAMLHIQGRAAGSERRVQYRCVAPTLCVPDAVAEAKAIAERTGFALSCEDAVGRFLAVLAASVPKSGSILEIGTGVGVGLAWLVSGLAAREDVRIVSCEIDPVRVALAAELSWPAFVSIRNESVFVLHDEPDRYDLVFADSGAGKWEGLDRTLEIVKEGGLVVFDDMTPLSWHFEQHEALNAEVRRALLARSDLLIAELAFGSGVILAARARSAANGRRSLIA